MYKQALIERRNQFGSDNNINVACALEELAYAHYVVNYQTGDFAEAEQFVLNSRLILDSLLNPNHLLLRYTSQPLNHFQNFILVLYAEFMPLY